LTKYQLFKLKNFRGWSGLLPPPPPPPPPPSDVPERWLLYPDVFWDQWQTRARPSVHGTCTRKWLRKILAKNTFFVDRYWRLNFVNLVRYFFKIVERNDLICFSLCLSVFSCVYLKRILRLKLSNILCRFYKYISRWERDNSWNKSTKGSRFSEVFRLHCRWFG
jgi:hypothetical protein